MRWLLEDTFEGWYRSRWPILSSRQGSNLLRSKANIYWRLGSMCKGWCFGIRSLLQGGSFLTFPKFNFVNMSNRKWRPNCWVLGLGMFIRILQPSTLQLSQPTAAHSCLLLLFWEIDQLCQRIQKMFLFLVCIWDARPPTNLLAQLSYATWYPAGKWSNCEETMVAGTTIANAVRFPAHRPTLRMWCMRASELGKALSMSLMKSCTRLDWLAVCSRLDMIVVDFLERPPCKTS